MDERIRESGSVSGWLFLTGVVIGAVGGLLLAPQSGEETREDIKEWGRMGREKTRDAITRMRGRAGEAVEDAKEAAGDAYEKSKEKARQLAGA